LRFAFEDFIYLNLLEDLKEDENEKTSDQDGKGVSLKWAVPRAALAYNGRIANIHQIAIGER
jgi:hypothetical protein